jgi:hypothetical protein
MFIGNKIFASFAMLVAVVALGTKLAVGQGVDVRNRITAGQVITGTFDDKDIKLADVGMGVNVEDRYLFDGKIGEQIKLHITSQKGFTILYALKLRGREDLRDCEKCGADSNGVITIPDTAEYVLTLSTLYGTDRGPYTISIEQVKTSVPPSVAAISLPEILDGESRVGTLSTASLGGTTAVSEWTYRGHAGERIRVTARAKKKGGGTPYVYVGTGQGASFSRLGVEAISNPYALAADLVITRDGPVTIQLQNLGGESFQYVVSLDVLDLETMFGGLGSTPALGYWKEATRTETGQPVLVDLTKITTLLADYPRIYRFRSLIDLTTPVTLAGKSFRKGVITLETECSQNKIQIIAIAGYDGEERVATSWADQQMLLLSGKVGDGLSKFVCNDQKK